MFRGERGLEKIDNFLVHGAPVKRRATFEKIVKIILKTC